ncbi:MAG: PH domain-containing protein [Nocardioidaceae bacterium]|nr:PH domain-containing protein [Nocardioidaceae bacterium]
MGLVQRTVRRSRDNRRRIAAIFAEPGVVIVRPGKFLRYVIVGFFVVSFMWIGAYELTLGDAGEAIVGLVSIAVAVAGFWIAWFRLRLAVGHDALVVRNPFLTHVVPLSDVASVEARYEGLRIARTRGRDVIALAVERHNISLMLGRRSKADDVADLIERRKNEFGARRDRVPADHDRRTDRLTFPSVQDAGSLPGAQPPSVGFPTHPPPPGDTSEPARTRRDRHRRQPGPRSRDRALLPGER